jgi:hypothetical protein
LLRGQRLLDIFDLIGRRPETAAILGPEGQSEEVALPMACDEFLMPLFFFIEGTQMVVSTSLKRLLDERKRRALSVEMDCSLLQSYHDSGLILPPFTYVRDVYRFPYLSELRVHEGALVLGQTGVDPGSAQPFQSIDEFYDCLRKTARAQIEAAGADHVICTVSGGSDSAVLLAESVSEFSSEAFSGIVCRMPSLEGEVDRAQEIGRRCGVRVSVFEPDAVDPERVVDEYADRYMDLVFDPVVPVITEMLRTAASQVDGRQKVALLEGQGADTALIGLPHNSVIRLHHPVSALLFKMVVWVLPRPGEHLRSRSRLAYRAIKAMNILAESSWQRALLKSLDFERSHHPHYYDVLLRLIDAIHDHSQDRHKSIMQFFLNILHVREAQKYSLLPEGVPVLLPFLAPGFLARCHATPTGFFFGRGRRKIPINERVSQLFPDLFSSERTTPFAVEYSFKSVEKSGDRAGKKGTYGRLKAYCIARLSVSVENRCDQNNDY